MTKKKKGSLLPAVALVAAAAAALLFLGVWTQAGRMDRWANEPVRSTACPAPFALVRPDFA